ncbi:hypothetical protein [Streptomyces abikoensis]|uniref:hypothetical protein n=1 Tax=Streptomyces abikoensis TaxID=97398 RepID=UPI00369DFF61
MPIAFKQVPFSVERVPMSGPFYKEVPFTIRGDIRRDTKGRPVFDVALQSFSLEVMYDGNPHHCSMSLDQIALEIGESKNTDDDGVVKLTIWRRNHPNDARNSPPWGFRGTVTALVIADLKSS